MKMPPEDASAAQGLACQHLGHLLPLASWVPTLVAAHALQAPGTEDTLLAMCNQCQRPLADKQEPSCGCQGTSVGLDLKTGRVHCLACQRSVQPEGLTQSNEAVRAAWQMLRSGMTPGAPANDPAPEVLAKRRRLSQRLQERRDRELPQTGSQQQPAAPAPSLNGYDHSLQGAPPPQPLQTAIAAPSATLAVPATGFIEVQTKDGLPIGLRGLNNLGNTCFMNSVLQAFLHTPLVRLYYLGDGHAPNQCELATKPCLSCEMDTLFSNMYSGERQPYSPVDFLYGWWCQDDKLAEYQQQDAHEFYITALAGLSKGAKILQPSLAPLPPPLLPPAPHMTLPPGSAPINGLPALTGSIMHAMNGSGPSHAGPSGLGLQGQPCLSSEASESTRDAVCEVSGLFEAVFGGTLRSDVRCCVCGYTSTAYDPFLDISLDLLAASRECAAAAADAQQAQAPGRAARHPGATPTPEASCVSGANGPNGTPLGRGGKATRNGASGAGPADSGPNTGSESCSQGNQGGNGSNKGRKRTKAGATDMEAKQLSGSSVQDGDMSQRLTPEISDVSSLLMVPQDAPQGAAAAAGAGLQKPPAPPRQRAAATAAAQKARQAAGRAAGAARGLQRQMSLECADSPDQHGVVGTNAAANASDRNGVMFESALDDSMSSPMRGLKTRSSPRLHGPTRDKTPASRSTQGGRRGAAHEDAGAAAATQGDGESSAAAGGDAAEDNADAITSTGRASGARGGAGKGGAAGKTRGGRGARSEPVGLSPSPLGSRQVTPEPSEMVDASMIEEPACSHLALQTVAWPVGQGQQGMASESRQETGDAGPGRKSQQGTSAAAAAADKASPPVSLTACLQHFIHEEALHVSGGQQWRCERCQKRQRAVKQMSIRRLPPVLCLHAKRFEHPTGSTRVIRKLQTHLSFPLDDLDMSPFMTGTLLQRRYQLFANACDVPPLLRGLNPHPPPASLANHSNNLQTRGSSGATTHNPRAATPPTIAPATRPHPDHIYRLYAVIVHKGDITGGHYIAYVRCCDTWFCCDDAWVTMVSEQEVAECQAYMLFYTQRKYDHYMLKLPQ